MSAIPKPLQETIEALGRLPGVGPRSAERYAYFIFRGDPSRAKDMAAALKKLHESIKYCPKTFALIEAAEDVSRLYSDVRRNKKIVAVVAEPFDVVALEKTNSYSGTYHVLGGLVSPIEGIGPDQLHLKELIRRIDDDKVQEVILATNASVEGESTALLVTQQIGKRPIKITRLARGLPIGVDLEYADQITLTRALEGRQAI